MEEINVMHLYKVDHPYWDNPTYVAATNQQDAIRKVHDNVKCNPDYMSVKYVDEILVYYGAFQRIDSLLDDGGYVGSSGRRQYV